MNLPVRLPSGVTIDQAKKDAKKRAKSLSIPLYQAQDEVARSNGLHCSWSEGMKHLNGDGRPLANFKIGPRHVQLTREKPVAPIIGSTGSGKSVASLILAEQHLKAGGQVVWATFSLPEPGAVYPGDLIPGFARALVAAYRGFTVLPIDDGKGLIDRLQVQPNTLIIIDEVALLRQCDGADRVLDFCKEHDCTVLLLSQTGADPVHYGWDDHKADKVAFMLLGRSDYIPGSVDKVSQLMRRFNEQLTYPSPEEAELLLVDMRDWLGKVVFQKPVTI